MTFQSKKDSLFTILILGLNAFLLGLVIYVAFFKDVENQEYWGLVLILTVVLLVKLNFEKLRSNVFKIGS